MKLECMHVFIDGPDCSGKSTLFKQLHKVSNFEWRLEDRSLLSMYIYDVLYGRKKVEDFKRNFYESLSDLKNKYVIFDLSWELLKSRYEQRGDEIHSLESLRNVFDLYKKELKDIKNIPNVLFITDEMVDDNLAMFVNSWLKKSEKADLKQAGMIPYLTVSGLGKNELSPLRMKLVVDDEFSEFDENIFDYSHVRRNFPLIKEATVEDFIDIKNTLLKTIDDECSGKNIYGKPQSLDSRRFIYSGNMCISFIQLLYRNEVLNVYATFRSSNVKDVFEGDLVFLYSLCKLCLDKLCLKKSTKCIMDITLNSAHIIP